MKKTILKATILAVVAIAMACGSEATRSRDKQKTYHVICYSGGQKVFEMEKATKDEAHYDAEIVKIYTEGSRTVRTPSTECFEEDN